MDYGKTCRGERCRFSVVNSFVISGIKPYASTESSPMQRSRLSGHDRRLGVADRVKGNPHKEPCSGPQFRE